MDPTIAQIVLDEVFPALEASETQNAATLQFLKERGIASDEDLAPFLEQSANASSVRWRAARLRVNYLLTTAGKATAAPHEKPPVATDKATVKEPRERRKDSGEHVNDEEKKAESRARGDRGTGQQEDENRGPEEVRPDKPVNKDEHAA